MYLIRENDGCDGSKGSDYLTEEKKKEGGRRMDDFAIHSWLSRAASSAACLISTIYQYYITVTNNSAT